MPFDALWIGTSWKMNKLRAEARDYAETLAASPHARGQAPQLFVIPPFTAVAEVADLLARTSVMVGVQNIHWKDAGPWTGEISAGMAADCGATLAEIGHSERRTHFGETDETVALKVEAALRHGLTPLVCVGASEVLATIEEEGMLQNARVIGAHALERRRAGEAGRGSACPTPPASAGGRSTTER